MIDQHCQARLVVVRAEPMGAGEDGGAVQRAPGNLGQGVGRQWDHVINARAALQTVAVAAICAALIVS